MSRDETLAALRAARPAILPSMLLCDFGDLRREVARLEEAGAPALHLDVMDGQFVPNFTYGLSLVSAFRGLTDLPLDVHLMTTTPRRYLREFSEAGADAITFHVEACDDAADALREIRALDVVSGVALNPQTPLTTLDAALEFADLVLVMSVPAGFGGQAFDPVALEKLSQLRARSADGLLPGPLLEVDGGVNRETIAAAAAAGAELFVVGSAIFRSKKYAPVFSQLTQRAHVR